MFLVSQMMIISPTDYSYLERLSSVMHWKCIHSYVLGQLSELDTFLLEGNLNLLTVLLETFSHDRVLSLGTGHEFG